MLDSFVKLAGFCSESAEIWRFAGRVVFILKILIPAILVIIGIIALGKAVISDDDKEIKTAVNKLIKKFIVAVVIFFVPTLIRALFAIVDGFGDGGNDYITCINCIANPSGCPVTTDGAVG